MPVKKTNVPSPLLITETPFRVFAEGEPDNQAPCCGLLCQALVSGHPGGQASPEERPQCEWGCRGIGGSGAGREGLHLR